MRLSELVEKINYQAGWLRPLEISENKKLEDLKKIVTNNKFKPYQEEIIANNVLDIPKHYAIDDDLFVGQHLINRSEILKLQNKIRNKAHAYLDYNAGKRVRISDVSELSATSMEKVQAPEHTPKQDGFFARFVKGIKVRINYPNLTAKVRGKS